MATPKIKLKPPTGLIPTLDRIIVERLSEDFSAQEDRRIIIPDNAKERSSQGVVVAVGPGRRTDQGALLRMDIPVGALVLFGKYSGTAIEFKGSEYLILREDDIQCLIHAE